MSDQTQEDLSATVPESWRGEKRQFRPRKSPRPGAEDPPKFPWLALTIIAVTVVGIFIGAAFTGDSELVEFLVMILLLIIGAGIYFIPTMVAELRHHRNTTAIILLNVFLGWTLLGWVGALIWAFYEEKK